MYLENAYLGYSEWTPTSAMPASSLHTFDNCSRLPVQGVFIEPGIDNVDTGLRSYTQHTHNRHNQADSIYQSDRSIPEEKIEK